MHCVEENSLQTLQLIAWTCKHNHMQVCTLSWIERLSAERCRCIRSWSNSYTTKENW